MQPTHAMYPVEIESSLDTSPATRASDVATAKAAEAAALERIATHVGPDRRDQFLARLQEHSPATISFIAPISDPELSKLISTYCRVRSARAREEQRQTSVDSARTLRRRLVDPFDVIVLRPDATVEMLNALLMRLDESRAHYGDDLFFGQTLLVAQPLATNASPYRRQLDGWIERLRHAPPVAVAEVGNVPAIEIHTVLLR